jgi:hypothetical protein
MTQRGIFREPRVDDASRRVRNRLRKHVPLDIASACIKKLNENPTDVKHLIKYPPWRLLLLIKWTLLFGEYLSPYRKPLTVGRLNYFLNLMHDFEGYRRHPSVYANIFLFFRNMAFQQFWLQHEFDMADFTRQNLMFGGLDSRHPFQTRFIEKCGISSSEFIELAMMLMTRFTIEEQTFVAPEWFKIVADKYEPGTIQKFLDSLAIDFDSLRQKLMRQNTFTRLQCQNNVLTPRYYGKARLVSLGGSRLLFLTVRR